MLLPFTNFFGHRFNGQSDRNFYPNKGHGIFHTFLIVHLVILATEVTWTSADPAWFQVCDSTNQFQLNSLDCPIGLWLKKPMHMGCVCVSGVWALSSGMCDPKTLVLVGSGDCFSVRKDIRSIKLIGNADDPFAPADYVTTPGFDTLIKIPRQGESTDLSPSLELNEVVVVSINPKNPLLRSDRELCLKVPANKLSMPVHLYKNGKREPSAFKLVNNDHEDCDSGAGFTKHVNFAETIQDWWVNPVELATQRCSFKCPTQPLGGRAGTPPIAKLGKGGRGIHSGSGSRSMASSTSGKLGSKPSPGKPGINWSNLYTLTRKLEFKNEDVVRDPGLVAQRKEIFHERFPLSQSRIEHSRETREQTVRMVQTHMNFLLLGQPSPKINSPEYLIFQKARQTFIAVAPPDLIPPRVVNGMMRMWRTLLWESHDKFAYREHANEQYLSRILETMNHCLNNVSAYPMIFIDDRNASSHPEHCLLNNTKTTFWNTTDPKEVYLSNTTIPAEVAFDYKKLDFVIELAWKMVMFTQYHCSTWFRQKSLDHSFMVNKMMNLFNPKVLKRWYYPEGSLAAYKLVFNDVNFEHIAYSVDRIAEAARDNSDFEPADGWLKRPKYPSSSNDLHMGNGARKKRDTKKHSKTKARTNHWNQKAVCMETYEDPVNIFQYTPPTGCTLAKATEDVS